MYSDDIIMMSLMRGLPIPQVLGDIEIAQSMKRDQEEASQKLKVNVSTLLLRKCP